MLGPHATHDFLQPGAQVVSQSFIPRNASICRKLFQCLSDRLAEAWSRIRKFPFAAWELENWDPRLLVEKLCCRFQRRHNRVQNRTRLRPELFTASLKLCNFCSPVVRICRITCHEFSNFLYCAD